jgi:iron complex outermembrane receptor protein
MRTWLKTALLAVVLILAPPASAEEIDDFAELDLEELLDINVYAAAKHEQDIAESPSAISVITREQIENTHCTDVTCLLRQLPEVDVQWILPMSASVGARALTDAAGDKALVMINGREINDEVIGAVYWGNLTVHMEEIERIEVIRGPGSALYGANAHSLVVSIITRKTTGNAAEVFLGSGERDRSSLHMRLDRKFGNFHLTLSGGVDTSGNWRIQDLRDRQLGRARLQLDYETEASTSTLEAGFSLGDGKMYTALAPTWVENALIGYVLLSHRRDTLRAQLSLNMINADNYWDLPLYIGDIKLGEPPEVIDAFSTSLDGEVQANWSPFEGNLWITGCNYRWITMISDANDPGLIHQHRLGLFLHNEQRLLEDLVLTLGVRFDYNNITPFTISPRLAGVWKFAEDQYLRVAVGQAFRKPSFFNTSIHIRGFKVEPGFEGMREFFRQNIGNDDLDNESITTAEAGYRGRFLHKRLFTEAVIFYNRYRDSIAMQNNMIMDELGVPDLANSEMFFDNAGREVDSLGGSVSATWQITRALRVHVNYTYRYSWYVSDPGMAAAEPDEIGKGDRVPWEPAHLVNLWFHYLAEGGLRFGAALHGRSSSTTTRLAHGGLFDDYVNIDNPARLFPSAFVSWRARINTGWVELGVRAYNFFHVGFRDNMAVTRRDGSELGGQLIGRRIFVFLRGAI